MQILNLLIWQKNKDFRNFEFKENKVNVITGDAGKGKTAVIHIIDYCMLSTDAEYISEKNIDEDVEWYGLVFKINEKTLTIARQASHINKANIYYSEIGEIPKTPVKKIEIGSLKIILEKEFGINSNMKIPYGGSRITAGSKITYRYFLPNCYQDKQTLTATDSLYMKYSDIKTQERLERTFGMAIGVENEQSSIIKERVFDLESQRDKLTRSENRIKNKKFKFNEEIHDLYDEAKSLNIVTKKIKSVEDKFNELNKISKKVEEIKYDNKDFERLEKEIFKKEQEVRRLESFDSDYKCYIEALSDTLDNLKPVEYLMSKGNQKLIKSDNLYRLVDSLSMGLTEVKRSILEKTTAKLIVENKEEKKELRKEIKELETNRDNLNKVDIKSYQELYLYIGKLTAILDFYADFEKVDDLTEKIESIKKKIIGLRRELDDNGLLKDLRLELLNDKINSFLKILTIKGYEEDKAIFDEKSKTINILRRDKSKIEKMNKIGSDSNYLNLHLAYFLSLHEIARENDISWMPSFLILDQVNSPYYDTNSKKISDDKERFDNTLKVLNEYVQKMGKYGFQIILLEHIEEDYWKGLKLDNFNLVGKELRGKEALILK